MLMRGKFHLAGNSAICSMYSCGSLNNMNYVRLMEFTKHKQCDKPLDKFTTTVCLLYDFMEVSLLSCRCLKNLTKLSARLN